jgi:hypothetical protein
VIFSFPFSFRPPSPLIHKFTLLLLHQLLLLLHQLLLLLPPVSTATHRHATRIRTPPHTHLPTPRNTTSKTLHWTASHRNTPSLLSGHHHLSAPSTPLREPSAHPLPTPGAGAGAGTIELTWTWLASQQGCPASPPTPPTPPTASASPPTDSRCRNRRPRFSPTSS